MKQIINTKSTNINYLTKQKIQLKITFVSHMRQITNTEFANVHYLIRQNTILLPESLKLLLYHDQYVFYNNLQVNAAKITIHM